MSQLFQIFLFTGSMGFLVGASLTMCLIASGLCPSPRGRL